MSTVEATPEPGKKVDVKRMSWDPITRIVGLARDPRGHRLREPQGREVLLDLDDLPRVRHLHEGHRSSRHALPDQPHLRHLRRQPLHDVGAVPEHGLRHLSAEARQLRLQPGGAGRLHVRPCDLQRLHVQRGLLRADGQGHQPVPAREGGEDVVAARRHPRLQDDRRHHAGAQPVHGRVLPGDPPGGPLHARDVLPVRRPPHAPLDDHAGRRLARTSRTRPARTTTCGSCATWTTASAPCRCTTTSTTSSSRSCPATTWSATGGRTSCAGAPSTTRTSSPTTTRT